MSLPEPVKNILSFLLRFGLSGALLFYLFKIIDFEKVKEAVLKADITFLLYGFVIFVFMHFLLLLRWYIFISALGLKVKIYDMVRYFFFGLFGNLFLPSAVGGDIIRIVGLCYEQSDKPKVVASVLLDRLSGFVGLMLLGVTSYFAGYKYHQEQTLLVPLAVVGLLLVVIGFVIFHEKTYEFICRAFGRFPKVQKGLMDIHYDIALLRDKKKRGLLGILVACTTHALLAVTFYMVAKALHQDIAFIYFLIFVPLICVSSAVPSVGGLGVREAGAAYLFSKIGISTGIAVSISLLNFSYMIVVGLGGGIFYGITHFLGRKKKIC